MKNLIGFQTSTIQTVFVGLLLFGVSSCGSNTKTEDSKALAEEHNEAKFDESKREKDVQFLVNAAEINQKEIQISKLSQSNSKNPEVNELGKMMIESHEMALTDITALAGKKAITLPNTSTDNVNDAYKELSSKSGTEFDKAYCTMLVKGHKDAIDKFQTEATEGNDQEIKEWAQTMLSTLRIHLDQAMTCEKKCEKM